MIPSSTHIPLGSMRNIGASAQNTVIGGQTQNTPRASSPSSEQTPAQKKHPLLRKVSLQLMSQTAASGLSNTPTSNQTQQNLNSMVRGSVAYVKMIKNSELSKMQLQRMKEEKLYAEKEAHLFDQFIDYKIDAPIIELESEELSGIKLKHEFDRISELNRKKEDTLKHLNEELQNRVQDDQNASQMLMLSMNSSMMFSKQLPSQSFFSKKSSQNKSASLFLATDKQDASALFGMIEALKDDKKQAITVTEEESLMTVQLMKKETDLVSSLDMLKKECNELQHINKAFDKKFENLELREITANKKNIEIEMQRQMFKKGMEDLHYRGQLTLSDRQAEKSEIYQEVKHLKNEMTHCLIAIDQRRETVKEQEQVIEQCIQEEKQLHESMKDSKYTLQYIDVLSKLSKLFLGEPSEEDERMKEFDDSIDSELNSYPEEVEVRKIMVERLNGFVDSHPEGVDDLVERLERKLELLLMTSSGLHERYYELIEQKKFRVVEARELGEQIDQCVTQEKRIDDLIRKVDVTEDVPPQDEHQSLEDWLHFHSLPKVEKEEAKKPFSRTIQEIQGLDDEEEQEEINTRTNQAMKNRLIDEKNEEQDESEEKVSQQGSLVFNEDHEERNNISGDAINKETLGDQDTNGIVTADQADDGAAVLLTKQQVKSVESEQMSGENKESKKKEKMVDEQSVAGMREKIEEENALELGQLREKIQKSEKLGFKIFMNQIETLFRWSQTAQDLAKKLKKSGQDGAALFKMGSDLMKFVVELRRGLAIKRSQNNSKNKNMLFIPQAHQVQVISRDDAKKFSFMEPLALRGGQRKQSFDQQQQQQQQQNSPTAAANASGTASSEYTGGYLPNSVSTSIDSKKNKIEKYLELQCYTPLDLVEIQTAFLTIFPNSQDNAKLFAFAVKKDMLLSFYESIESIIGYLRVVSDEFEKEEEASVEAIRRVFLMREECQKLHWTNVMEVFAAYQRFQSTLETMIAGFWKEAGPQLKVILKVGTKPKKDEAITKTEKKYQDMVVEKHNYYSNNEAVPLSEPITEYKNEVNVKDLEESAKEKANTEDLKKIIVKLADANPKKKNIMRYAGTQKSIQKQVKQNANSLYGATTSPKSDINDINLLDQKTKKQIMQQYLTEDVKIIGEGLMKMEVFQKQGCTIGEFLAYENKHVKDEIQNNEPDLDSQLLSSRNSFGKYSFEKKSFYLHKNSTSHTYLKSFLESDKVIGKLKQLENKREGQPRQTSQFIDDYIPKMSSSKVLKTLESTQQFPTTPGIPNASSHLSTLKINESPLKTAKKQASETSLNISENQAANKHSKSKSSSTSVYGATPTRDSHWGSLLTPLSKDIFQKSLNIYSSLTSLKSPQESERRKTKKPDLPYLELPSSAYFSNRSIHKSGDQNTTKRSLHNHNEALINNLQPLSPKYALQPTTLKVKLVDYLPSYQKIYLNKQS